MDTRVCPVWLGHLLSNPLRRLVHKPEAVLAPYVQSGMTALDVGCAMGFFSLPLAGLVGPTGRVICLDLQQRMLDALEERAQRAGLSNRVQTRLCQPESLNITDLAETVDFALAIAVIHEVPDPPRLFAELRAALRHGGQLLVAEPWLHVSGRAFEGTLADAEASGFQPVARPTIGGTRAALLAASG